MDATGLGNILIISEDGNSDNPEVDAKQTTRAFLDSRLGIPGCFLFQGFAPLI